MSQRESQRAFIFQGELDGLRSKKAQEDHGSLFGLWTNDNEAVIYVISGSNRCCSNSGDHDAPDIYSKQCPLTHIGNWWYSSTFKSRRAQTDQMETVKCLHTRRSDFLHLLVTPSTSLLESMDGKEKEIVSFPEESPFRRMEGIEDSNTELSRSSQECDCHGEDSDTNDSSETNTALPMEKIFIFKKDYEVILSKAGHKVQGSLFGLWTTDGEPVIHIVGFSNCCPRMDNPGSDVHDILSHDFPLVHIGNWRSGVSSTQPTPQKLSQMDDLRCPHETKSMARFLDVIVWGETLQVSIRGRKIELEVLPAFESPFRYLQNILESKNEDPSIKQATEAIKHMSITGDFSIKEQQTWNSPRNEHTEVKNTEDINMTLHLQKDPIYLRGQQYQKEFAVNRQHFKVFMFEEDLQMMAGLVLKYPNLETGGDLFGLWTTNGDAVLHVILGPGQNCKRTGASFYQDIAYLQRNGELLTEDYMLCHIGEWHSHHQMHLFQPSGGDSSTVIRNYPPGVCGFLLIIANIVSSQRVKLSPYLYTKTSSHSYDVKGELIVLCCPNIFKSTRKIKENMHQGRELQAHLESENFSGHRPKSYKTPKYYSKSNVNFPVRTHEPPQSRTSQKQRHTQYMGKTLNSRWSRPITPRNNWNRRHLVRLYKATTWPVTSRYTHFGKNKSFPIWKP